MKSSRIESNFLELSIDSKGSINGIEAGLFLAEEFPLGTSIYKTCPFLEGTLDFLELDSNVLMEGIMIAAQGQEFICDVDLLKGFQSISVLLHDRTKLYNNLKELNQSRNDLFFLKRELKEKNEELVRQRQLADKANEEKSRFLAMMSHEVRNPLNVILGYTELLTKERVSRKIEDYLKNLTVAGRNLKVIVDDILDLSRVEAGKLELSKDPISLSSIVDQIEGNYRSSHKDKELDLKFSYSKNLPKIVLGDDVRIYQILTNLINNSIKFTPRGSVSTELKFVSATKGQAKIHFIVSDTGRGMTQSQAASIFEEYQQNELDDNRIHKGAGLGLAIVKRLVSAMNGSITVESELGKGTTFLIDIDFQTVIEVESKGELKENPTLDENRIRGSKILVADDNYLNRSIVEHILKREEAQYLLVKDGVEALNAMQEQQFDLVLLDINMPNLSGEDLIKQKQDFERQNAETPFVALTGNSSKQDIKGYLEIGFVDVIPKPFSSDQLVKIVNRNLAK